MAISSDGTSRVCGHHFEQVSLFNFDVALACLEMLCWFARTPRRCVHEGVAGLPVIISYAGTNAVIGIGFIIIGLDADAAFSAFQTRSA